MNILIYIKWAFAALIALALAAAVSLAVLRGNALQKSENKLQETQLQLEAAKTSAEIYQQVNQELLVNLDAANRRAHQREKELDRALIDNQEWAEGKLPESVKKAIKK